MLDKIDHIDKNITSWLNSFHSEFWDAFMLFITHRLTWIPLYAFLLFWIVYKIKGKKAVVAIISIVVFVILSEIVASKICKPGFERLRPSHSPEMINLHIPGSKGGKFGFFSAHASNTMTLAMFLFLLFGKRRKWIVIILWSVLVAYSRIYVGKHYLGDILTGLVFGGMLGYFALLTYQKISKRLNLE